MIRKARKLKYNVLDNLFFQMDKRYIRRSRNISKIPEAKFRRGGKASLSEWSHVIGVFQTLIGIYLPDLKKGKRRILDIGCGTGLLAIASEPHIQLEGEYVGIDVMKNDIDFCRKNYNKSHFKFIHHSVFNPTYSQDQSKNKIPWEVESDSVDLVTALSVWTHLDEQDAIFYFKEISRVLKKGGRALITFFVLDDHYYNESIEARRDEFSNYHGTKQKKWIFDRPAYDSKDWFTTKWVRNPEDAIGVNNEAMRKMLDGTDLEIKEFYPGNWREQAAIYFQDVVIFEKK